MDNSEKNIEKDNNGLSSNRESFRKRKKGIRKKMITVLVLALFFVAFPSMVTFFHQLGNDSYDEDFELMGKYVVIKNKGVEEKLDVENFIPCVLSAQMDLNSPKEALKAQTVIIRTYIVRMMGDKKQIPADELGLTYITYEQMKESMEKQQEIKNTKNIRGIFENICPQNRNKLFMERCRYLNHIIQKTNLMVMKSEGNIILPLFHKTSAGVTRDGKEILGEKYSYLKSVKCEEDKSRSGYLTIKYFTVNELLEKLKSAKIIVYKDGKEYFSQNESQTTEIDADEFISLIKCTKDKTGYVTLVKIFDTSISGQDFSKALGVTTSNITIEKYENGVRIMAKGQGHGIGLSMSQAETYAMQGMDYQKILKTFYDVSIVQQ